jgi:hypothetical protein
MARNTPPTLVSYTETSWSTIATSKSTASISWQTGDVIVFIGGIENGSTIAVPTATGLTFSSVALNATANTCGTRIATATAASTSSGAVTATTSNFTWGFAVWVWRGSDGVGSSGEQHTTTHTKSVVPTDTHSAWMWGAFDFSAAAATNTITPTPTNTDEKAVEGGAYTAYVADIIDQASGASTAYGISAGGTTGVISLAILEVLGTTSGGGGSTVKQLAQLGVG